MDTITVSVSQARMHFYELARKVQEGDTVIITFGRKKTPVVKMKAIRTAAK